MLALCCYQQQGMSYDAAVKTVAAAELASPTTLRTASKQFAATGALTPPRTPVDRSNPLHPFYIGESGPSLEAQLLIHQLLHQVALENTYESCNTLRAALAAKLGITVSRWTVRRWLHSLGYVYGKKHFVNSAPSYRWTLIRCYIYQYAAALKEQEEGKAIIVYMDESYIHSHHCSKFLWHSLSSATKNEVRGDCKGKRIIIMHAMTMDAAGVAAADMQDVPGADDAAPLAAASPAPSDANDEMIIPSSERSCRLAPAVPRGA